MGNSQLGKIVLMAGVLLALGAAQSAWAAGISVVVGQSAPPLEQFAASELRTHLGRLFRMQVTIDHQIPDGASAVVLLGHPRLNPVLREVAGETWPKLSPQGVYLRAVPDRPQPTVIVGGGSPVATLWAAYELSYRFGARWMLREDVFPAEPRKLDFGTLELVDEPELKTRVWRAINDFAIGPESWPLEEYRTLLGQLAKQRFNRVLLSVYPWHPFVHYESGGVAKSTGTLWFGEQLRIPRDAPGIRALGNTRIFTNPDFAGAESYQQRLEAGVKHARGLIDAAHQLGMTAALGISPLEFPREFSRVLPGAKDSRGPNQLLIAPGAGQAVDDAALQDLVAAKLAAYLSTYPKIDALYLTLPEFPEWDEQAAEAWKLLAAKIGPAAPELSALVEAARERTLIASGDRGARSLKSNVVALAFLERLFRERPQLLRRPDGKRVELVITAIDPALFPYLDRILPAGAGTLNFVDYTARRVAENLPQLDQVPAAKVSSGMIMTLADDNVGVLSQAAQRRLAASMERIRKLGWDGFSTRYWMLAELDPAVHYLARAAWDPAVTPRSAHDDLFTATTGKQAVADRLWLAFGHIEAATELIDKEELGFAFPVKGMLLKHARGEPLPKWWEPLNEQYTQAMVELYRSHDAAPARARKTLFYWAKRSEYVLEYLAAVKALRESAIAQKEGDGDKALEQMEAAVEQLYNAIDTLSDVARDHGDRGLIATLIEYAYRPLMAEYEKLLD